MSIVTNTDHVQINLEFEEAIELRKSLSRILNNAAIRSLLSKQQKRILENMCKDLSEKEENLKRMVRLRKIPAYFIGAERDVIFKKDRNIQPEHIESVVNIEYIRAVPQEIDDEDVPQLKLHIDPDPPEVVEYEPIQPLSVKARCDRSQEITLEFRNGEERDTFSSILWQRIWEIQNGRRYGYNS